MQNNPSPDNQLAPTPPPTPSNQSLQPKRTRPGWLVILLSILSAAVAIELVLLAFFSGLPQYLLHHNSASHPTSAPTVSTTTPKQSPIPTSAFHAASCPFKLGDGIIEGKMVKCGYVTVPENRSVNNGHTIRLALAIFKSPSVTVDPAPVIRLDGGPGSPSLDNWAHYVTSADFNTFVFNHDLIMFDQRGTGYSQPSLNCPEILNLQFATINQHLSRQQGDKLSLQAAQACHNRLVRMGIDLNAYNTLENAADVRDIIHALGYQQMTIYGVSYGTRLALTVMRLYPSVIRAVVLDSVYPPQKNRTDLPAAAQRVFHVLFQGCAADPTCNQQYPDLQTVFYKLVNDLNAHPISFQTTDFTTNKSYTASFAGDDLIFWLYSALYATVFIPELPQTIFQIRNHNYNQLSQIYGFVEFDDTFSYGLFYSAECSEDWAFLTKQDIAKATQGIDSQMQPTWANELQNEYDTCQLWKVKPLSTVQKQPVTSNLPTLILSGEYDPITPPSNAQLTEQTLKNSYLFLFPGMGHGEEYNSDCADSIISNFENNPTLKPSATCINNISEPAFK